MDGFMNSKTDECFHENVTLKEIEIPIGNKIFNGKTDVCDDCGSESMTPRLLNEIDEWVKAGGADRLRQYGSE